MAPALAAARPLLTAALTVLVGCGLGLGGDESIGAFDHLPTLAAGPYGKPNIDFDTPAEEPYVLVDGQASLMDPAPLWRDDGGFRLWFSRAPDDGGGAADLWYAELAAHTELPDRGPEPALVADAAWEEGRMAAPAVVDLGGGALVMFYEGGRLEPGIGRADSSDGGTTWHKHPENPLLVGAAPTAAVVDDLWLLFYTRPGHEGIFRADSFDGTDWAEMDRPVLTPRTALADAFDAVAVSDPFALVRRTGAGRWHYGLFFNGTAADGDVTVGFAGSWDGLVWERFGGVEPVLSPGSPTEHGPAVLVRAGRGTMFFHEERQRRQRIAVALHP
jgi:hypothetical protein